VPRKFSFPTRPYFFRGIFLCHGRPAEIPAPRMFNSSSRAAGLRGARVCKARPFGRGQSADRRACSCANGAWRERESSPKFLSIHRVARPRGNESQRDCRRPVSVHAESKASGNARAAARPDCFLGPIGASFTNTRSAKPALGSNEFEHPERLEKSRRAA